MNTEELVASRVSRYSLRALIDFSLFSEYLACLWWKNRRWEKIHNTEFRQTFLLHYPTVLLNFQMRLLWRNLLILFLLIEVFTYINTLLWTHYCLYINNSFTGTRMAATPHNIRLEQQTLKNVLLFKKTRSVSSKFPPWKSLQVKILLSH